MAVQGPTVGYDGPHGDSEWGTFEDPRISDSAVHFYILKSK